MTELDAMRQIIRYALEAGVSEHELRRALREAVYAWRSVEPVRSGCRCRVCSADNNMGVEAA